MTPLARMASLLVAFYLLTSAAPAHAHNAWVLWERWLTSRKPDNPLSREAAVIASRSLQGNGGSTL
jgi:hypothetical protein